MIAGHRKISGVNLINSRQQTVSLFSDVFKMEELKSSHSRNYSFLNVGDGSIESDYDQFEPTTLRFSGRSFDYFTAFKSFYRGQGERFRMQIFYDGTIFYCDVVVKSDIAEFHPNGLLEYLDIEFTRLTHYYKEVVFDYDISNQQQGANTYPYTYPFTYTGSLNTYANGSLLLLNQGDIDSPMRISINGLAQFPSIAVNSPSSIDNFTFLGNVQTNSVLVLDTLDTQISVTLDGVNVQDQKDNTKNSYIKANRGNCTLLLKNIRQMKVVLYELYYNL